MLLSFVTAPVKTISSPTQRVWFGPASAVGFGVTVNVNVSDVILSQPPTAVVSSGLVTVSVKSTTVSAGSGR